MGRNQSYSQTAPQKKIGYRGLCPHPGNSKGYWISWAVAQGAGVNPSNSAGGRNPPARHPLTNYQVTYLVRLMFKH